MCTYNGNLSAFNFRNQARHFFCHCSALGWFWLVQCNKGYRDAVYPCKSSHMQMLAKQKKQKPFPTPMNPFSHIPPLNPQWRMLRRVFSRSLRPCSISPMVLNEVFTCEESWSVPVHRLHVQKIWIGKVRIMLSTCSSRLCLWHSKSLSYLPSLLVECKKEKKLCNYLHRIFANTQLYQKFGTS